MAFVIGLIVGLVAGAAIAYFLTSKQAARQSAAVQDLQRQLALAESEHERRLREATDQLRQDYAAQSIPQVQPINASPAPAAATPPTLQAPLTPSETPTAPLPIPSSQAVTPNPTVAEVKPFAPTTPAPTTVFRITDPNAVLAASYAPEAATRSQVAAAIAKLLPQSEVQTQARWLPVLGRLTRDADATVRLSAIQALEPVTATKRLPLLRRALKDTDPAVVEAANALISQTKGRYKLPKTTKKRRLPKNR